MRPIVYWTTKPARSLRREQSPGLILPAARFASLALPLMVTLPKYFTFLRCVPQYFTLNVGESSGRFCRRS